MLSNLITAKSLDANPETHANNKTVNVIKLFQPAGLESKDFITTLTPKLIGLCRDDKTQQTEIE